MLLILGLVLMIIWVIALAHYEPKDDGCIQNTDECNTCPFPCDKRKNLKGDFINHEN